MLGAYSGRRGLTSPLRALATRQGARRGADLPPAAGGEDRSRARGHDRRGGDTPLRGRRSSRAIRPSTAAERGAAPTTSIAAKAHTQRLAASTTSTATRARVMASARRTRRRAGGSSSKAPTGCRCAVRVTRSAASTRKRAMPYALTSSGCAAPSMGPRPVPSPAPLHTTCAGSPDGS